jgi:hypothetical protein
MYILVSISTGLCVAAVWVLPALSALFISGATNARPDISYHGSPEEVALWSGFISPAAALLNLAPSDFLYLTQSGGTASLYFVFSAILSIIAFSILLVRRNRIAIFACVSLTISTILSAGSNLPITGKIYVLLYESSFLFATFNRPYFFQAISTLMQSFSLGIFASFVRRSVPQKKAVVAIGMLSLIIVGNSAPILSGNFNGALKLVSLPKYYSDADAWLRVAQAGRLLLLPPYSDLNNGVFTFQNPLVAFASRGTLSLQGIVTSSYESFAINSIYLERTSNEAKLLGVMGIRYILIDLSAADYSFAPYQNTTEAYRFLRGLPGLEEVWTSGPLHILRNDFSLPEVFVPHHIVLASGDVRTLATLASVKSFDLNDTAVAFADQLGTSLWNLMSVGSTVLVQDNDWEDLVLNAINDTITVNPWSDASGLYKYGEAWTTSLRVLNPEVWRKPYFLDLAVADSSPWVLSEAVGRNVSLSSNFVVPKPNSYEIWAKVFTGFATIADSYLYEAPVVSFLIDGTQVSTFYTNAPVPGRFDWVDLGTLHLSPGTHTLELVNQKGLAIVSRVILTTSQSYNYTEGVLSSRIASNELGTIQLLQTPVLSLGLNQSGRTTYSVPPNYVLTDNASYGFAVQTGEFSTIFETRILTNADYTLAVRIASNLPKIITMQVEDMNFSISVIPGGFKWYNVTSTRLSKGTHEIRLFSADKSSLSVDSVLLESTNHTNLATDGVAVSYKKINSAEYSASVNCASYCPSLIVLTEPFAPLWKSVPGQTSIEVDSYSNGFVLSGKSIQVLIEYSPQELVQYGAVITLSSLSLVGISILGWVIGPIPRAKDLIPWRRRNRG